MCIGNLTPQAPVADTAAQPPTVVDSPASQRVSRTLDAPAALAAPRGRDVLDRFPGAEVVEVDSHWKIPELHGNEGQDTLRAGAGDDVLLGLDVASSEFHDNGKYHLVGEGKRGGQDRGRVRHGWLL